MKRRRFMMKGAQLAVAAVGATAIQAPNVIAQPKVQWKMPTSWTPAIDILLGAPKRFAQIVEQMSGGRMKVEVFAAGELMPALGVFDAVSQGTVESYHSSAYYYSGKEPAFQWFTSVPFGMNAQGHRAWYHVGDGIKLFEEAYAPFNLVPRPGGAVGVQMAGWFRKKINTTADFKGLKLRMPGLGGKIMGKLGATVVLLPAGEVYTALERGVIDAAEWIGPHDDMKLGLHRAARYYYSPGWHELSGMPEFAFHRKAWDSLTADLKHIVEYAAGYAESMMLLEYDRKNALALHELQTKFKGKVEILPLPAPVLEDIRKAAIESNEQEAARSPMSKKIYASYTKFQKEMDPWALMSEQLYYSRILRQS